MLEGFEEITQELTVYEKETLLPKIVAGLCTKKGKSMAITNRLICEAMKARGFQVTGPRLRKIVNYIRTNGLLPGLIATSQGYYITESVEELDSYIHSLAGRASEINKVRRCMVEYRDQLTSKKSS